MARYGYFFGDKVWFGKPPSKSMGYGSGPINLSVEALDSGEMANIVLSCSTTQKIHIEFCCDGLVIFDFKEYQTISDEKNKQKTENKSTKWPPRNFDEQIVFTLVSVQERMIE